jgi:hypothetical protein
VAQLRLHDGGLAEGDANVEFVLRDLPAGIDVDELVASLRPSLQSQEELLSELLLGDAGIAGSRADIYLEASTDDGEPWLYFREPGDAPGAPVYTRPGFFGDFALAERISERVVASGSNDTTHEKLRARAGQQAYFSDDTGAIYRLQVLRADSLSADVLITLAAEAP